MNDDQVLHALHFDDAYEVKSVLADGPGGTTELVFLGDAGPFVRKKLPEQMARRSVWSALAECDCRRLPHVVATYELPDRFVVVYDYVPGESLESLVAQNGALDARTAVDLACDVCEAAGAMHACNIIHRDISPANIILAADGAHVIDLGIARLRVEGVSKDTAKLGTWGFASPEQFGFAQTDARSDVYSIGRLVGYMLCAVRPDDDAYETCVNDASKVPPALQKVLARACAFEPSGRYQSAAELSQALRNALQEERETNSAATSASSSTNVSAARQCNTRPETQATQSAPTLTLEPDVSSSQRSTKTQEKSASQASVAPLSKDDNRKSKIFRTGVLAIAAIALIAGVTIVWSAAHIGNSNGSANTQTTTNLQAPGLSTSTNATSNSTTNGNFSGGKLSADDVSFTVAESATYKITGGYIGFAVAVRNESDAVTAQLVSVTVTGKGSDGAVLFSEKLIFNSISPGQTAWDSSITLGDTLPATLECTVDPVNEYLLSANGGGSSFTISNVNVVKQGLDTNITGELRADTVGSMSTGVIALVAVLRDEAGNIVYASNASPDCPPEGSSTSFSVYVDKSVNFATAEVYACL